MSDRIDADALPKTRIVAAGVKLFSEKGAAGATIRAIADAASVQAPTIFRHFGDKDALLDAIAERMMADFLRWKTREISSGDPIDDLRDGTAAFMAFGVAHPDLFIHMFARPDRVSQAALAGQRNLRERVRQAALTGRLTVSEQRAYDVVNSVARGTVLLMLERPEGERRGMIDAACEAIFAAISVDDTPLIDADRRGAATLVRAHLDEVAWMSPGERLLIAELLQRIADERSCSSA